LVQKFDGGSEAAVQVILNCLFMQCSGKNIYLQHAITAVRLNARNVERAKRACERTRVYGMTSNTGSTELADTILAMKSMHRKTAKSVETYNTDENSWV